MAGVLEGAVGGEQQFGRKIDLIVFGTDFNGLNLSELRIKFSVKRSDTQTPNCADIRVYNLEEQTALKIATEFKRVILQAGYGGNFGVIFQGNIKQVILGRESATDTFIDIIAGDGDRAYNFAVVNTTLMSGSTKEDQIAASVTAMTPKGVTAGNVGESSSERLPRGKVMYGNARNYLTDVANSSNQSWSIQEEKVTFVPNKGFLPGEIVILTSNTGMIGTPQQTNEGVNVKCLLNPKIKVSNIIKIDNKSVERLKLNLSVKQTSANIIPNLTADGTYFVLVVEHQGDTRGVEWYSSMICLNQDATAVGTLSVQVNYGE